MEKISERIKSARETAGLMQLKAACKMGISHSQLSHWEKGERIPGAKSLVLLAQTYAVTTDYLLGLSDTPVPSSPAPVLPEDRPSPELLVKKNLFMCEVEQPDHQVLICVRQWLEQVLKPDEEGGAYCKDQIIEELTSIYKMVKKMEPDFESSLPPDLAVVSSSDFNPDEAVTLATFMENTGITHLDMKLSPKHGRPREYNALITRPLDKIMREENKKKLRLLPSNGEVS